MKIITNCYIHYISDKLIKSIEMKLISFIVIIILCMIPPMLLSQKISEGSANGNLFTVVAYFLLLFGLTVSLYEYLPGKLGLVFLILMVCSMILDNTTKHH